MQHVQYDRNSFKYMSLKLAMHLTLFKYQHWSRATQYNESPCYLINAKIPIKFISLSLHGGWMVKTLGSDMPYLCTTQVQNSSWANAESLPIKMPVAYRRGKTNDMTRSVKVLCEGCGCTSSMNKVIISCTYFYFRTSIIHRFTDYVWVRLGRGVVEGGGGDFIRLPVVLSHGCFVTSYGCFMVVTVSSSHLSYLIKGSPGLYCTIG